MELSFEEEEEEEEEEKGTMMRNDENLQYETTGFANTIPRYRDIDEICMQPHARTNAHHS